MVNFMMGQGRVEKPVLGAGDKDSLEPSLLAAAASIKLSVITVCYNAGACIENCVRSVVNQIYQNLEYIIIDGGSSDGTLEVLNRYRSQISILISEPDGGIYPAMNKGLSLATGDLIYFLNADDYFVDHNVARDVVEWITDHPAGDVYYGSIEVRREDGTRAIHEPVPPETTAESMVCGCLPHQGTFARHDVFKRSGPFDESYRYHADYDWFLKVIADPEIKLVRFNRVVASFQLGGRSSQLADGQPEVYRIQNASPLYQSEEWSRRRIAEFQKHLLIVRVENAQLKAALHKLGSSNRYAIVAPAIRKMRYSLNAGAIKCFSLLKTGAKRFLPRTVVQTLINLDRSFKRLAKR
jgi:glycosyltransferase involved in cell wall biosynthesis